MKVFAWLDRRPWLINLITFFLAVVLVCLGDWFGWALLVWMLIKLLWWLHTHAFKVERVITIKKSDGTETKKVYVLKHQWED